MSSSTIIDLSQLPPPQVVESLDFERIFAERKAYAISLWPAEQQDAIAARLELESEPITKLLQESAYRETILRQRINDAALASLLAYATGNDLINRAADYGVEPLLITPADPDANPPTAAVYESDERLRYRTQRSLDALSSAGSRGAYEFHALTASASVGDVSVDSPTFRAAEVSAAVRAQLPAGAIVLVCDYAAGLVNPLPGDVSLAILPIVDSPVEPTSLVTTVLAALTDEDVRPITDRPRAMLGKPIPYRVVATLELEKGPSPSVVEKFAKDRLNAAIATARKLEGELALSAIYGALHVTGVKRVLLTEPTADIVCDKRHHPECTGITLKKVVPE